MTPQGLFFVQNRNILYKFLTETPREQLFKIPEGFNNNIWWNIAHVVVTQQLLVYKLSNLQMRVDDDMVEAYKKGTFPKGEVSDEEIKKVAALLLSTVEWLKEDYENGLFKEFNSYTTSVNVTLKKSINKRCENTHHRKVRIKRKKSEVAMLPLKDTE